MDVVRAKEILETLADGVNPMTGEILPEWDSCNQAEVVRALHTILKSLESIQEKAKKALPENAGKPWSPEDEEILCRMYETGCSTKEICSHFRRTKGAIAARLVHLGKIAEKSYLK